MMDIPAEDQVRVCEQCDCMSQYIPAEDQVRLYNCASHPWHVTNYDVQKLVWGWFCYAVQGVVSCRCRCVDFDLDCWELL